MSKAPSGPNLTSGQKALFYIGAGIATLAILGPTLALAAVGAANLVTLGGCVVVLFGAWMARPWFALKWKNTVLKLLKAEARNNPIETLENAYIKRAEKLKSAREHVGRLVKTHKTLKGKLDAYVVQFGEPDKQLAEMLNGLAGLIEKLAVNIKTAEAQLVEEKKNIQRQTARYKIALETGDLAKQLRQTSGDDDPLQAFLHDEAMDSVLDTFNGAMTDIDMLLEGNDEVPQLVQFSTREGTPIETTDFDSLIDPHAASLQRP